MSGAPGGGDDARLAREIAAEAGQRLLALRARYRSGGRDPGGGTASPAPTTGLRDAADQLSHEYITAELARRRPGDAVLSEEGPPAAGQPDRLTADRVWIVDPLDGTREFGEPGRTDWAVHVALWERGHPGGTRAAGPGRLTAGAVALPAQGVTLSTLGAGAGADGAHGGRTAAGTPPGPFRIVVSRTRRQAVAEKLSGYLGGAGTELLPLGSAGAKAAAVLAGDADAYLHEGGFYEWDTAAPVAVARAAGFHASRLDGRPLRFNQDNVWMPDILICPSGLAGTLLDAIGAARSAGAGDVTGEPEVIG
jgi:3'(2'), 5'-bisphosphate nucleotidase